MAATDRSGVSEDAAGASPRRDADMNGSVRSAHAIGLIGYFGWGNFGDELMRELWANSLLRKAESHPVHDLLHRPYFRQPARSVADTYDALLIGGGDLVRPESISPLYWNRAWLRRPVTISGVGVALEEARVRADVVGRLAYFFGHPSVQSISARDAASAEWIREHLAPVRDVRVCPDLAFAAGLPPAEQRRPQVMGIVLRKQPSVEDVSAVRQIQTWAHGLGFTTEFLVLATGATREQEWAALRATFGPESVIRTADSNNGLASAISSYGALFTAKFHGAVIAYRYAVPPFSLRRTHKVQALAQALKDPALTMWAKDARGTDLLRQAQRTLPCERVSDLEHRAQAEVASVVSSLPGSQSILPLHAVPERKPHR